MPPNCVACDQPNYQRNRTHCENCERKQGVKSPRTGSAKQHSFQNPTFESQNKCKEKVYPTSRYDASKYMDRKEEYEARLRSYRKQIKALERRNQEFLLEISKKSDEISEYVKDKQRREKELQIKDDEIRNLTQEKENLCKELELKVQEFNELKRYTDLLHKPSQRQPVEEEENLTSEKCSGKLLHWLDALKQSFEKVNNLYSKEWVHSPQSPKGQKIQTTGRKVQTKKSTRPMSAVSEELIHLRKNIEILESVAKLWSYNPAQESYLQEKLDAYKSELNLKDKIIDELKVLQNTDKELTETWKLKVESIMREKENLEQEVQSIHLHCEKKQKTYEAEKKKLQNANEEHSMQEKLLRFEFDTLKKDSQKAQNRKNESEAEVKKLEKRCSEQREEINLKTQEISHLHAEMKKMKSGLTKQTTVTLEVTKKKQSEAITNKRKDDKMREEVTSLKNKSKAMENENEKQKKQLEVIYKQMLEKERDLKSCIREKQNCDTKIKQFKAELKQKEMEIGQMKVECKEYLELKANMNQMLQNKDSKIASLKHEIESLKAECKGFPRKMKDRDIEHQSLKEELNDLQSRYDKLKKEYNVSEKRLKEEKEKMKRFGNLEIEIFEEKEENNRLRQEVLEKEIAERKMLKEIDDLTRNNTELEHELAELSRELQQSVQSEIKKADDRYFLESEKNALLNEIGVLNDRMQSMKLDMEIISKEKQTMRIEAEEIEYTLQSKEKHIRELSNERKRLKTEMEIMKEEINNGEKNKQNISEQLRFQIEYTQKELLNTKDKLNSWQKKCEQIEEEKRDADNRSSEFEKALAILDEENIGLKEEIARMRKHQEDYHIVRKEMSRGNNVLLEKENEISALKQELCRLREEADRIKFVMEEKMIFEQRFSSADKEVKEKKEEIRDLQLHLNRLQTENINLERHQEEIHARTKKDVAEKENKLLSAEDELNRTKSELSRLKCDLDELKRERIETRSHAQETILEVSAEKSIVERHQQLLQSTLVLKDKELNSLIKQLERSKETIVKMTEDTKEREENISRDTEKIKRENSFLHDEIRNLRLKMQSMEVDAKEITKEAERKTAEKDNIISSIKEGLRRVKSELARRMGELKEKERRRVDEQANTQEKFLETSNEKSQAERRLRRLETDLLSKDKEIENLEKQLKGSKETLSVRTREVGDLEARLHQTGEILNKENKSLKEQVMDLESRLKEAEERFEQIKKDKLNTEQRYWHIEKAIQEKDVLIGNLREELERTKIKHEELLKDTEIVKRRTSSDEVEMRVKQENILSLQSQLSNAKEAINKIKQEENKWQEMYSRQSNILKQKEKEIVETKHHLSSLGDYKLRYETTRAEQEKILQRYTELSKDVESKERDLDTLKHQLAKYNERVENLTKESNDLRRDKQNMENKITKMTKAIQQKEKEIEDLVEQLAKSEEKAVAMSDKIASIQRFRKHDTEERAQLLLKENNALKLELKKVNSEAHEQISVLNKEIKNLQKPKVLDSEESLKKLHRENTNLKSELERVSSSLDQLRRDYTEVKREKDHASNRLSSVAREKLRDNNPGIVDLSDENRPINLGEKFSQLYDDQWTDAMENLEENLRFGETEGIQCLLSILKRIFDECVRISDDQFAQLKEITGTTNLPSDQLKKLKDLRKSTALQSVKNVKQLVNKVMLSVFSKEKDACQSYIDRCIELCWLMCVQDPPVVIDFTAVRGQVVDDKMLRKFTKTGSKIDFLVWPMIRLHKNGPLLQKGVVQPL